jgi:chromosome segregation ATPase
VKAELARETESRAAAEKQQTTEIAGLRKALERERADRERAEEQLQRERRELQAQLDARNEAHKGLEQKLEAKTHQVQHHQAAVVELRKEIVLREQQWQEQEKVLSKARAELVVEREARIAAEDRAGRASAAQQSLEKELADRQDLQQQMQHYAANLNSLRSKLQAKRRSRAEPEA